MEAQTKEDILRKNEAQRSRCEVWTRVMGYHRPYQTFNHGKKSEFAERQYFEEQQI